MNLEQRLSFVTGKGGVGKSTVAAALALKSASKGAKTLLVELEGASYFSALWNFKVAYQPKEVLPGLFVAQWTSQECLREYALHLLKVEALYKLFLENSVSRSLIEVAPGLREIALLGKATSGPRKVGPPLEFDQIVIDAPASGHFLALVRAPLGLSKAIRFGPMGEQSRSILSYINNSKFAEYFVVCLPEELPLLETKDLVSELREQVGFSPKVILNRSLRLSSSQVKGSSKFATFLKNHLHYEKEFKKLFQGLETSELSWVLEKDPLQIIQQLSEEVSS